MKTSVAIAILVVLTLCSFVPFADRAVYLDEPLFLHIAKSVWEKDWLFPQSTSWIFFGIPGKDVAAQTHPPVGEYCLAVLLKLCGGFHEVPFHLAWGLFSVAAVLAFYRLTRSFTGNPLMVSALFAASPAFFVNSQTLMMDIPMLAFLLAGLAFYLDGLQGKRARLWAVPLCFLLSAGTGYTALIPIGCLFIWAICRRRPLEETLAIAAGPVLFLGWQLMMKSHFGAAPMASVLQYVSTRSAFPSSLLPTLSFLGGLSLFPWAVLLLTDLPKKRLLANTSFLAAVLLSFFHEWPSYLHWVWYIVLASAGIAWILILFVKSRQGVRDSRFMQSFLILWVSAALLFFLLVAEMASARFFLLSLPPLLWIVCAQVKRTAAAITLAATIILSVSLAIGDYRHVNRYRRWVAETVAPLQDQGFRLWSAAESGLRFYLNQRGIPSLDIYSNQPRGGDLVVRQSSFALGLSGDLGPLLVRLSREDIQDPYFWRLFGRPAGAGFHDSRFGIVPFIPSQAPLDQLEIVQVSPFVKGLPQVVPPDYSSVPVWFPGGVMLKQIQPEMEFPMKIPPGARIDYQIEGEGAVEVSGDGIRLRKKQEGPVVWKNFRIIPAGLQHLYEWETGKPNLPKAGESGS